MDCPSAGFLSFEKLVEEILQEELNNSVLNVTRVLKEETVSPLTWPACYTELQNNRNGELISDSQFQLIELENVTVPQEDFNPLPNAETVDVEMTKNSELAPIVADPELWDMLDNYNYIPAAVTTPPILLSYSYFLHRNDCKLTKISYPSTLHFSNKSPSVHFSVILPNNNYADDEYYCYFDICEGNSLPERDWCPIFSPYDLWEGKGPIKSHIRRMTLMSENTYEFVLPKFSLVKIIRNQHFKKVLIEKMTKYRKLAKGALELDGVETSSIENTSIKQCAQYPKNSKPKEQLYVMACVCIKIGEDQYQRITGPFYTEEAIYSNI